MKTYRTDVLIIGAGGAGLRAAVEAKANGAEVIIVNDERCVIEVSFDLRHVLTSCGEIYSSDRLHVDREDHDKCPHCLRKIMLGSVRDRKGANHEEEVEV